MLLSADCAGAPLCPRSILKDQTLSGTLPTELGLLTALTELCVPRGWLERGVPGHDAGAELS
jgi:hypothetical protein